VSVLPPHLYEREGLDRGIPPETLSRITGRRAALAAQGAYPLLSLGQLAHETGASYTYLREVVARRRDPYQSFEIRKRNGGTRAIAAPEPMLMDVQRWMLVNLLDRLLGHPASYAYQTGLSIVDCANQHRGARWLIKLDIHDFFGSVTEPHVYKIYRRLGYHRLMAFELGRLSTRAPDAEFAPTLGSRYRIQEYSVSEEGRLPQGAPTSGQLANAAALRLDRLLSAFAARHRLVYTRYSDDLTFSSAAEFRRGDAVKLTHALSGLIRAGGFTPHRTKTRIVPPGARHVVLGLLVEDEVRLLPEHARRIDNHLRGCEKYGLESHALHRGFDSVLSFGNHLDGWIAFAMGVDRPRATEWRQRLLTLIPDVGSSASPSALR